MADSPITTGMVRFDLIAEQRALDAVVVSLADEDWDRLTPSPGWTVRDQIGHLAYFDEAAALAIESTDEFVAARHHLAAALSAPGGVDRLTLGEARAMGPAELLDHWRSRRQHLAEAAGKLGNDTRVEWYGPPMGAKSFLTARLMECWAHGQDVVDTLGADRPPTDRLGHIARLGFMTRKWTYANRRLPVPEGDVRVELTSPTGQQWSYGPARSAAASTVSGTALDFCLVTSQRTHLDDTDLIIEGDLGRDWLEKAQMFAGPPSDPPQPINT